MNDSERQNQQAQRPEYGAMRGDYPGCNPYPYGAPDPAGQPVRQPDGQFGGQFGGQPAGQPANMRFGQPPQNGRQLSRMSRRYGIDLDDPRQNPLYGHWDPYAVIAFVVALLFSNMPILPAVIGALAMWRTRTFHMKGFGLALAAVIVNVLTSLVVLWAAYNGMSLTDMALQLYGLDGGGSQSGGDTQTA